MSVTVSVYDPTNTTLVSALDDSHDRRWQDRYSEPGAGSLQLQNDDTDRAACTYGRVLRFAIDGTPRFAALVEAKTVQSVSPGEEADLVTEVKGRGTMAAWEALVVYPEGGAGASPLGDTRPFSFASSYFDDSSWAAAVQIEQGTGDVGGPRAGFPIGLPAEAETAWWIWSQANDVNGSVPPGDAYFRKTYVSPGELVRIVITADNAHELYLNGQLLEIDSLDVAGGVGWAGVKMLDRFLPPGSHLFAVKCSNVAGPDPNPSGFIMAVIRLTDAGSAYGPVVLVTDSSWKTLGYPSTPPGFTPRRILEILLAEAQARGAVPALTLGGTNTADVDGYAWPVAPDIAFRVGLDGLSVLRQLAETYIDAAMDPASMRLDVWVHGGKGGMVGPTYEAGENMTEAIHEMAKPTVTAILGRWSSGWREVADAPLVAANGRREGFLSVGDAQSTAELDRVAGQLALRMGVPTHTLTIAIEPAAGDVPYVDFTTGDPVTVIDSEGITGWRAKGITVTEDPEGNPIYVPELEA